MIPLRSIKISGHVQNPAVKCQATENTYSKNSPLSLSIYRSCIKSSIEVLKYNQIHPIYAQTNPYIF